MRVFVAGTMPLLATWWAAGEVTPSGPAYAVTPALREWYRDGDAEELEHVAQLDAGRGAVELLAHDLAAPRRRIGLAADVADATAPPMGDAPRSALRLNGPIPRRAWACVLVDDIAASVAVATAVANLGRAALGDEDAAFSLDEADAHELGWYAVQEIPHLLADAGIGVSD